MPACSCKTCVAMCRNRPCWGNPTNIRRIIKAGYGHRLMLDYWAGGFGDNSYEDLDLLCPAIVGHEGGDAPFWPTGTCTFLTPEGRCEIHDIKPIEGRLAMCDDSTPPNLHEKTAVSWDTPAAQKLVADWRKNR